MFRRGEVYRKENGLSDDHCLKLSNINTFKKKTTMSKQDINIMYHGDEGQGDRLFNSKKK